MSNFTDTVKQDTPRLVVMFTRPGPDQEAFQWGIAGQVPLMSLIGYITRVQAILPTDLEDYLFDDRKCDEPALVIAWVEKEKPLTHPPQAVVEHSREFRYFVHPDIPADSLVGMLETIKGALVSSQLAQQVRNQQIGLLGPDGQPMRRR